MREDHANKTIFPGNTKISHHLGTGTSHTLRQPLSKTGASIRSSKLIASTSCTYYRSVATIKLPSNLQDKDPQKNYRSCRQRHHEARQCPVPSCVEHHMNTAKTLMCHVAQTRRRRFARNNTVPPRKQTTSPSRDAHAPRRGGEV
jgi:hypothetical protein